MKDPHFFAKAPMYRTATVVETKGIVGLGGFDPFKKAFLVTAASGMEADLLGTFVHMDKLERFVL